LNLIHHTNTHLISIHSLHFKTAFIFIVFDIIGCTNLFWLDLYLLPESFASAPVFFVNNVCVVSIFIDGAHTSEPPAIFFLHFLNSHTFLCVSACLQANWKWSISEFCDTGTTINLVAPPISPSTVLFDFDWCSLILLPNASQGCSSFLLHLVLLSHNARTKEDCSAEAACEPKQASLLSRHFVCAIVQHIFEKVF